ncbi:MAG: hypothetical protein QOI26_2657, partial [Pseudonocardiales bacterium]|nr:hypothetical protein [Pseudonocardiales bacterium]
MTLAHAFGQRYELPIPLLIFVLGGGAVVLASFALIAIRPVSLGGTGAAADSPTLGSLKLVRGSLATAVLAALVVCGLGGSQVVAENILPTL